MRLVSICPPGAIRLVPTLTTRRMAGVEQSARQKRLRAAGRRWRSCSRTSSPGSAKDFMAGTLASLPGEPTWPSPGGHGASMGAMSKKRAKKIKLLLFDVDGVLTDGKLFIFPAPARVELTTQQHASQHGGQGGFGLHSTSLIEAK